MISVIVATYNGAKYIIEQLDSLRLQTRQPDELIISDDCSTDDTVSLVQNYIDKFQLKNWKLQKNTKNKGFQKNFLDLLVLSKGEIIFFADQDDIWHPKKLELMERTLQNNEQIWTLCCGYHFVDAVGNKLSSSRLKSRKRKDDGNIQAVLFADFLNWWSYPGMSMAIRRNMLEYIHTLNFPDLIAHDWAFNLISCYQKHFYFLDKDLVSYRQHDENVLGGIMDGSHDFDTTRIITVSVIIKHFKQALHILNKIPLSEKNLNQRLCYLSKKCIVYEYRLHYLKNTNIFGCLSLIRFIKYYPRKRAYLGDILCCLKLMLNK